MSIEINIKNKSKNNTSPSVEYITDNLFRYGSFDGTRLNHNERGPDGSISMFNPNLIGRSISVDFGKDEINLYLPLPTSAEEIDDFYNTAKRVADFWGGEVETKQDGTPFDPYNSEELAEDAKITSEKAVGQILNGEFQNPILFCALWAIYLDKNDVELLKDGKPLEALRDFMHKMQNIDAYYARPNLLTTKRRDGIFGMYVFSENVVSIIPAAPRIPLGLKNPKTGKPPVVEDWYICLYSSSQEKVVGHVMYDDFFKALKPENYIRYDAQNYILKDFSLEQIEIILKKFGTSPP